MIAVGWKRFDREMRGRAGIAVRGECRWGWLWWCFCRRRNERHERCLRQRGGRTLVLRNACERVLPERFFWGEQALGNGSFFV